MASEELNIHFLQKAIVNMLIANQKQDYLLEFSKFCDGENFIPNHPKSKAINWNLDGWQLAVILTDKVLWISSKIFSTCSFRHFQPIRFYMQKTRPKKMIRNTFHLYLSVDSDLYSRNPATRFADKRIKTSKISFKFEFFSVIVFSFAKKLLRAKIFEIIFWYFAAMKNRIFSIKCLVFDWVSRKKFWKFKIVNNFFCKKFHIFLGRRNL